MLHLCLEVIANSLSDLILNLKIFLGYLYRTFYQNVMAV